MKNVFAALKEDGFLIARQKINDKIDAKDLDVVLEMVHESEKILLIRNVRLICILCAVKYNILIVHTQFITCSHEMTFIFIESLLLLLSHILSVGSIINVQLSWKVSNLWFPNTRNYILKLCHLCSALKVQNIQICVLIKFGMWE